MSHKAFHQREIEHLQEQNCRIVEQVEICEQERDRAHEQLRSCEERDAELNGEVQGQRDKLVVLNSRLQQDNNERMAKDEHVKVLGEQNNQMLTLLEAEEKKSKDHASRIADFEGKNKKLQRIADQFDIHKAELEAKVAEAKEKAAIIGGHLRHARSANENLRSNIQNTEAKTRVEIEALGQALQVVDNKNLEYMGRINKQETREKTLEAETNALKEEVENVRAQIEELRKLLEGEAEGRGEFERRRSQIECTIQALEVQADTLKKALSTAERANEQLQGENKTAADRCRDTADKVYALMDSLRLNQVELKKQEAENGVRDKKILTLERQSQNLQAKISHECDAKILAEQERKEAEQEAVVLKKKNKIVEEGVTKSQVAQERAEKDILEFNEKVSQQQTQNAYLASRIDTQEEEKNIVKAEIKKMTSKSTDLVSENTKLRDETERIEEEVAVAKHDIESFRQELAYIKREDVLDDAGRMRPILIQSNDSNLLEKLQINEFLYEAQQARNPTPPMVEKVAQLLAMLHEGQGRADQHLADLSRSNGLVSALRQRNMALFSRAQMFESFKTRALLRYVMNMFESETCTQLFLDSLGFGIREINEMLQLVPKYGCAEKLFIVSLIDNGLDDDAVNLLLQLVYTFPYLRRFDLKRNCFSPEGVKRLENQLRTMEGVTGVVRTADGVMNVHSGNQLRLALDVSEQVPKEHIAKEADFTMTEDLAHKDADPFLSTNSGASGHPWTKSQAGEVQKPPHQAIPDSSSTELSKPTMAPSPPAIGGPPVGLGGPGNVAALNKRDKPGAKKLPDKKQASRAKVGPPPNLDACADCWPPAGYQDTLGYPNEQLGRRFLDERTVGRSRSIPSLVPCKGSLPPVPLAPQRAVARGVRRKSLASRR